MKNFRRFALLSTLATYTLIFIGGLVRVSGAGLEVAGLKAGMHMFWNVLPILVASFVVVMLDKLP